MSNEDIDIIYHCTYIIHIIGFLNWSSDENDDTRNNFTYIISLMIIFSSIKCQFLKSYKTFTHYKVVLLYLDVSNRIY